MILAADIGGTKSLFAFIRIENEKIYILTQKRYLNKNFDSFTDVLSAFINEHPDITNIEYACFALAGPIIEDKCYMVNLDWEIDKKELLHHFSNIQDIKLCNDLEAVGFGIKILPDDEIISFTPKLAINFHDHTNFHNVQQKKCAILAPGTGLGEAFLYNGTVFPSEGSHSNFGPNSEKQLRLWEFLFKKFDHVSYERILSGPGIREIFLFMMKENELNSVDFEIFPEEITRRAIREDCKICKEAIDLFIEILGSEAGNLALRTLAIDGIYLGGGILPKIMPIIQKQKFLNEFYKKGRFSELMKKIPIFIILNSNTALYGAAMIAANTIYPSMHFKLIEDISQKKQ